MIDIVLVTIVVVITIMTITAFTGVVTFCILYCAGNAEQYFQAIAVLSLEAGPLPGPSRLQRIMTVAGGDMVLTDIPRWLWLLYKHILIPLFRCLNIYQPFYPDYVGQVF